MELRKSQTGNVYSQMNGMHEQAMSTLNTMANAILGIYPIFHRMRYQTTTSSVLDSLVNHLVMQEKNLDLRTLEGLSFLRSLGLQPTKDPDIYCLKTSKVCLVTTREKLSRQYLRYSPIWGIELNGVYLIAGHLEYPKIEKGFLLSELIPGGKRAVLRFKNRNQKNIEGDYAFCIDVGNTGGVEVAGVKRKLTPEEKEALQGFTRGWTSGFSDNQRSKMMGNAVTTNVISAIIRRNRWL